MVAESLSFFSFVCLCEAHNLTRDFVCFFFRGWEREREILIPSFLRWSLFGSFLVFFFPLDGEVEDGWIDGRYPASLLLFLVSSF